MEEPTPSLQTDLKIIEAFVNETAEHQGAFLSQPRWVLESFNINLSEAVKEHLDEFAKLISARARIADPVTMIFE